MSGWIRHSWRTRWILTLTAGILLGLSFPPFPMPFLVFPAFLLIFRIVDLSASAREAAFWVYPGFVLWNIIVTYWLTMATIPAGIAAILANAAVMTIPVMLQYRIQQYRIPAWFIALLQTASWLIFEYFHHQWDLAWPWLSIGNAWSNAPAFIQYISVTGFWGITFWVIITSALTYQAYKNSSKMLSTAASVILIAFPLWSGGILLWSSPNNPSQEQEVAVVQPNFDSYERYGGYGSSQKATNHLLQLSDYIRTKDTELILWPENAIQNRIFSKDGYNSDSRKTKQILSKKAREWNTTIVTGATYYEYFDDDTAPPLTYQSESGNYLPYNAALAFYPDDSSDNESNSSMEVYRKHELVPVIERLPFVGFFSKIDVFDWVNWSQIQGYGKGQQSNQFTADDTDTPALICYDSVYPSWVQKYARQDVGYLSIITNDGWWGNSGGHLQHFAYARLRAIELNKWVVRSANNGISGIIAADGSVKKRTNFEQATAFSYKVPVLHELTYYARWGDWLPFLMMAAVLISLPLIEYRSYSKRFE